MDSQLCLATMAPCNGYKSKGAMTRMRLIRAAPISCLLVDHVLQSFKGKL